MTAGTIERRILEGEVILREGRGGAPVVSGYAALYSRQSQNLGGFVEIIEPGAFDSVVRDDVRALFNHDPNLVLARSRGGSGTLRLTADRIGLRYEFALPDLSYARDLAESLRLGNVTQSSFAFSVRREDQTWEDGADGLMIRRIRKFSRLYDVSPVTYPAYLDTSVALSQPEPARGGGSSDRARAEHDARKRRLQLLELEG